MEYSRRLHRFLAFVIDLIILAVIGGVLSALGIIKITIGGDAEEVDTVAVSSRPSSPSATSSCLPLSLAQHWARWHLA